MKYFFLLLAVPVMMSETCKSRQSSEVQGIDSSGASIPVCVQHIIDSVRQLPKFSPPAEVTEYQYKGKKVFLFTSDCCDMFNPLLDESCVYVCAPHGGITGRGDFKCTDFDSLAKKVRVVWKDER